MTIYAKPSKNAVFTPVKVTGGRKYRGSGFMVSVSSSVNDYGWRHTGYGWARNVVETETARIWVPELRKFKYANSRFVDDDTSVTEKAREDALQDYCNMVVQDTIDWCRSKKPGAAEDEVLSFARNVLRKHHPEIDIDHTIPDARDAGMEIKSTIKWALTLRTRPCWMYGRHCPGGKMLSGEKYVAIARKALVKRGISSKEGFEELFKAAIEAEGLPYDK